MPAFREWLIREVKQLSEEDRLNQEICTEILESLLEASFAVSHKKPEGQISEIQQKQQQQMAPVPEIE